MSRRRAPVIAVAVVAPLLLVAALVALRSGDSAPRKLPVASGAAERSSSFAVDAAPAGAPFTGVRYEAGPGLPALTGTARAYKVTGTIDVDAARRVARAFGMDGEPRVSAGGFSLDTTDGRRLFGYTNPGALFTYMTGRLKGSATTEVVPSCGGSPDESAPDPALVPGEDCEPLFPPIPPHPAGFPSEAEAKAQASDVLRAAGVAIDGAKVDALDDGYAWQVTVTRVVDGMSVDGLESSVTVDETGIVYAWGSLGHVEPVDAYPLIGTTAAIAHLNDGTDRLFGRLIQALDSSIGEATCSSDGTCSAAASSAPACPLHATCDVGTAGGAPAGVPTTLVCPPEHAECSAPPAVPAPACAPAAEGTCPSSPCDPVPGGSCEQVCKLIDNAGGDPSAGCRFGYSSPCPAVTTAPDSKGASILCLEPDLPCGQPTTDSPPYPCPPPEPSVPPEPQVVTLTDATLGLTFVPAGRTDGYLIPMYHFSSADGFDPEALAIDASWLEPPAPIPFEECGSSSSDQSTDESDGCSIATDDVVPVPCSTPGAEGPCFVVPPETLVAPAPPPTCGPPVAKADGQTAGSPAPPRGGCPIN